MLIQYKITELLQLNFFFKKSRKSRLCSPQKRERDEVTAVPMSEGLLTLVGYSKHKSLKDRVKDVNFVTRSM